MYLFAATVRTQKEIRMSVRTHSSSGFSHAFAFISDADDDEKNLTSLELESILMLIAENEPRHQ
jgi:Fe-S cluster assembly iron-binding protein IscA